MILEVKKSKSERPHMVMASLLHRYMVETSHGETAYTHTERAMRGGVQSPHFYSHHILEIATLIYS